MERKIRSNDIALRRGLQIGCTELESYYFALILRTFPAEIHRNKEGILASRPVYNLTLSKKTKKKRRIALHLYFTPYLSVRQRSLHSSVLKIQAVHFYLFFNYNFKWQQALSPSLVRYCIQRTRKVFQVREVLCQIH